MKPKKKEKTQIIASLPVELKRRLDEYAREHGEPASHYIRAALHEYLDAREARA